MRLCQSLRRRQGGTHCERFNFSPFWNDRGASSVDCSNGVSAFISCPVETDMFLLHEFSFVSVTVRRLGGEACRIHFSFLPSFPPSLPPRGSFSSFNALFPLSFCHSSTPTRFLLYAYLPLFFFPLLVIITFSYRCPPLSLPILSPSSHLPFPLSTSLCLFPPSPHTHARF